MSLASPMWTKLVSMTTLGLVLVSQAQASEGRFTLLPQGGRVPFEATCFDDVATAELLTWREFQEQEFKNRLELELNLQSEELMLQINTLGIRLEESTIRYEKSILLRDEEIKSLREIIKKDRKANISLIVAGSMVVGGAAGFGLALLIKE